MIDKNVDRMSVNILPFSLDRALSDVGGALQLLHLQPQPGSVSFVAYGLTRIFVSIISKSKVQVMKFLISYRTSDIIWKRLD
jgi:hypothetical protein